MTSPGRPSPRSLSATALVVVVLIALVACSPSPPTGAAPSGGAVIDPTPQLLGTPAPPAQVDPRSLPSQMTDVAVVQPGWDLPPVELDGIFLGLASPTGVEQSLRAIVVDSAGTVLWQARRPVTCTGFTLSRAGEAPIAVLTDVSGSPGGVSETTATAYDLATGRQVWGPVDVPGPHQGPGLVFAAPTPESAMGDTGPRVMLDPATGDVAHDERADPLTSIVGEYDGVLLTARDGVLTAQASPAAAPRWTLPLGPAAERPGAPDGLIPMPGTDPPRGTALVAPAEPGGAVGATGTLVDLSTGGVVASDVRDARRDPVTGVWVVLGLQALSGYRSDGPLWQHPVPASTTMAGTGGVLAFLRVGDAVQAVNALTGDVAVAYENNPDGAFAVPDVISSTGAAVVAASGGYALITDVPLDPSPAPVQE